MLIKNQQKDAVPSTLNLAEFAQAMKQVDLSAVPKEKRSAAIFDHFMTVMANNVTDTETKYEILMSQHLRRKNV